MRAPAANRCAAVLAGLSAIAAALLLVVGYAHWAIGDSGRFADRATVALQDDSVRDLLAQRVTDEVILQRQADLLAARPLLQSTVSSVVGGRAFGALFRAAVDDVHRAVFADGRNTVTLTVADVGTVVAVALERVRPDLAARIDRGRPAADEDWTVSDGAAWLVRAAASAGWLVALLGVLYGLLFAGALWRAADRRRAAIWLGVAWATAGLAVLAACVLARDVLTADPRGVIGEDAARAVWDAFFGDLRALAWLVAGAGAVVAAAAASMLRPRPLGEPLQRLCTLLAREPRRTSMRALRGVLVVLAGIVMVVETAAVVSLLVTAAGVYLVYEGSMALLSLIYSPEEAQARGPRRRLLRSPWAIAAVAGAVILSSGAAVAGSGVLSAPGRSTGACNGARELCARPFDEVVLPATHNSMSAPLPGWFSAEQERPIPQQLEDGIRGLLIDTYFADLLPNGRHRPVFGKNPLEANGAEALPPEAQAAALRIRDRLGFEGKGERGMYLCHGFCELGATPVGEVLRAIHDFLVTHPDDVLLIINQDDVPPADFVAEVRKAGLEPFAYDGRVSAPWPTLREMIDRGQRLVIFSEHEGGAAPWYRVGYDAALQETPFQFAKVAQLTDPDRWKASCVPNRGPETGSLLLLNHWITNDPIPLPSRAAQVNAYEPLLGRARACERERGMVPNILAVNFYRRGDVFRVARTLNGLDR